LVVGGVGGLDWCGIGLKRVAKSQHLRLEIRDFPWGLGFGRWHADLTNVANRDARARDLADIIERERTTEPRRRIYVVAKSGGSGIAVKALEQLGESVIERIILLAPALSADYDLGAALAAVRTEMVVFWSPLDFVVLGAGTRLFGTIDRVRAIGAGLVGFRDPRSNETGARSSAAYAKLRQVRWSVPMALTGNLGGHMGPDSPLFLRKYVVPLLTLEGSPSS
jgi:hypothetical protein